MMVWKYKIIGSAGTIITRNTEIAERKSKSGYLVYCKRESNIYKYTH